MASFSVYHSNAPKRNFVLDVFRGLAVVLMIVVDAVPDLWTVYPTLVHSPWEGIHAADLAFPGFVFAIYMIISSEMNSSGISLYIG